MSNAIIRRLKPEEKELLLKREELLAIRLRLADLELELIDFRSSLARFEGRYLREVGIYYAELDEWRARIAELLARLHPSPKATTRAEHARQQASQSKEDSHAVTSKIEEMFPSPEIKKLYREVAKLVHPDLATTPSDRERRNRFMVDANHAYEAGNQDELQRLLDDFVDGSEIESAIEIGAELVRIIRQISLTKERLTTIAQELAILCQSEIAGLMKQAEQSRQLGIDMLAQLQSAVKSQIELAVLEFNVLSQKRSDPNAG